MVVGMRERGKHRMESNIYDKEKCTLHKDKHIISVDLAYRSGVLVMNDFARRTHNRYRNKN